MHRAYPLLLLVACGGPDPIDQPAAPPLERIDPAQIREIIARDATVATPAAPPVEAPPEVTPTPPAEPGAEPVAAPEGEPPPAPDPSPPPPTR